MRAGAAAAFVAMSMGCAGAGGEAEVRALLRLPDHFETPHVPAFNPLTAPKIELGRRLFHDERLSGNQTQSCASCHDQAGGFAEDRRTSVGSTGDVLVRNSQGLANVAYLATLTWANDGLLELEDQIHIPLRADNPVELGVLDGNKREVMERLDADPETAEGFEAAFPDAEEAGATVNKVVFALASFLRTLISGNSPYDRFLQGDRAALTEQQLRGFTLFHSEQFECFHCHAGVNLTVSYRDVHSTPDTQTSPFFNNGLYDVDGEGSYPVYDQGLYDLTLDPAHRGLFRPPSLRNVAVTAPYMHDGSIATLREVVLHYQRGGSLTEDGPNAGDGRTSPLKSGLVRPFAATSDEIDAVVAFLESLTDPTFLTDPALGPP